jgi:sugar phosphate isomerase/epimerase
MYFGACVAIPQVYIEDVWPKIQIERIKFASKQGIKYMNFIGAPRFHVEMKRSEVKLFKQVIDDYGIVPVQAHGGAAWWGAFNPKDMEVKLAEAEQYLDDIKYLGYTSSCLLPPVWNKDMSKEVSWGTSIPFYRRYAEMSKERGLAVAVEIEPELEYISCDFHDGIKWLEDVNMDNVFLNVDTGHFTRWRFRTEWLKLYTPLIVQGHITDTDMQHHEAHILGTKECDIVGMLRTLIENGIEENSKKAGVPCAFIIEFNIPRNLGQSYEFALAESIKYLQREMPELKMR